MTHTPPIPEASRSPFPIAEPPHDTPPDDHPANLPVVVDADDGFADRLRALPLGKIGAAMGLGATLIAGVLLGLRRGRQQRPAKRA